MYCVLLCRSRIPDKLEIYFNLLLILKPGADMLMHYHSVHKGFHDLRRQGFKCRHPAYTVKKRFPIPVLTLILLTPLLQFMDSASELLLLRLIIGYQHG